MLKIDHPFTIAFDGCHKCYVVEDETDRKKATESNYDLLDFENWDKFVDWFTENTCRLRFLNNWKLDKSFIAQGEL